VRIAVISVHTSPLDRPGGAKSGGLNVYVLDLSRHLVRLGCQVDIFTRMTHPVAAAATEVEPGLRVIDLPAGPARPLPPEEVYPHLDAFSAALLGHVAGEGGAYDVVHSHYWLAGLAGEAVKRQLAAPHITMFHTLGEAKNRASLLEHETDLRIQHERQVALSCERVLCATEHERDLLVQLYGVDPAKVSVIPLGVDMDLFRQTDKAEARQALGFKDEKIILFVGRLEPIKGVDILLNAAALLESDVECSVLIVGGDEASAARLGEFRDLASALGIDHRVAFVGAVDHDRLPLFYNAADVCVVPSRYESFGLVALEAMACGVPVVASRVGGLAGTVKDGESGYLVPWLCPEPFAERLEMLLDNDSLRKGLGETAREVVGRYRWENVAEVVLGLYRSLTGPAELLTTGV
jgi:D-inositol-3-phosphate glycosyltransferase